MKPLVIELFAGRFGWSRGFVAEGYRAVGFDIAHEDYHGAVPEGCSLALQDVLTLHGSQFRDAACIVASPPCQAYSYMAMPWKLGKAKAAAIRADVTGEKRRELTALFDACFRIQREACAATKICINCQGTGRVHMLIDGPLRHRDMKGCAPCCGTGRVTGRYIPLVVENVKGAQPWVGRAAWSYGSFYLWGDVPALMPFTARAQKFNRDGTAHGQGSWFKIADSKNRGSGIKVPGMNFHEHAKTGKPGRSFQPAAVEGVKNGGDWFGSGPDMSAQRRASSGSVSRKAASAKIAEIPFDLAQHIARVFKPRLMEVA